LLACGAVSAEEVWGAAKTIGPSSKIAKINTVFMHISTLIRTQGIESHSPAKMACHVRRIVFGHSAAELSRLEPVNGFPLTGDDLSLPN
jgi:hypothetical protein